MKKHAVVLGIVAMLVSSVILPSTALAAGSAFEDGFEGNISGEWLKDMPDTSYAGGISDEYAMAGSSSLRIELNKKDPVVHGSKRSELTLPNNDGPAEERTYSFATYLPDGGDEDYAIDPQGSEIIAQWHNIPDPGESWTSPPLALHTYGDHYELWRFWDDAQITSDEQMMDKGNFVRHDLGAFSSDKGRWVQWTYHIKWGWEDSQNPRIQVYKDGVQVLDVEGPNTTNDLQGNYMKLGIYKWDWAQGDRDTSVLSKRVIYYDNVSIQ